MNKLENKGINLLIDFDSTFVKVETLDSLATISLKNNPNKYSIINQISRLTSKAMQGDISFDVALFERIKLLKANQSHIREVTNYIDNNVSESIKKNKQFFKKHSNNCFIISGGFKEIILPIVKPYGFKEKNVFGNTFVLNRNKEIKDIDRGNPLSKEKGKITIAKNLNDYLLTLNENNTSIIIGDGYTDFEIKKFNQVKFFIQFIENINRKSLNNNADYIAKNFEEVIRFINNKF